MKCCVLWTVLDSRGICTSKMNVLHLLELNCFPQWVCGLKGRWYYCKSLTCDMQLKNGDTADRLSSFAV